MADIGSRLEQDKAMRDAARRLVETDLAFVRESVEERSVPQRAARGARQASQTLAERALDFAREHPLAIGGGIAAIGLILLRNPILDLALDLLGDEDGEEDEPETGGPHLRASGTASPAESLNFQANRISGEAP